MWTWDCHLRMSLFWRVKTHLLLRRMSIPQINLEARRVQFLAGTEQCLHHLQTGGLIWKGCLLLRESFSSFPLSCQCFRLCFPIEREGILKGVKIMFTSSQLSNPDASSAPNTIQGLRAVLNACTAHMHIEGQTLWGKK